MPPTRTGQIASPGHGERGGADKDPFVHTPEAGTPVIAVHRNRAYTSHIDLPVIERR